MLFHKSKKLYGSYNFVEAFVKLILAVTWRFDHLLIFIWSITAACFMNNFMFPSKYNIFKPIAYMLKHLPWFASSPPHVPFFVFYQVFQGQQSLLRIIIFLKQSLKWPQMENLKTQFRMEASSSTTSQTNLLRSVIEELSQKYDCQKVLLEANKKYQIKQYNILSLSVPKVLHIYENLKSKFYSEPVAEVSGDQWYDNELRLFIWLLVTYCHIHRKNSEDLSKKQWTEFNQVFEGKNSFLFEYQARIIRKPIKKSKKWTLEEDQSLGLTIKHFTTLLGPIKSFKWSEVAKKLFIASNKKHFRTPKQCRERWMNHLDPEKVKSKWSMAEDYQLVECALTEGKKWALISKMMGSTRTEHMVKNRYNSLLRTEMKKHEEMADEMRVIRKLYYRMKYMLESKAASKETIEAQENGSKEAVEANSLDDLSQEQQVIMESQQHEIEAFDDILETLNKQNPLSKTSVTLLELVEENNPNMEQNYLDGYELRPNFPDVF